MTAVNDIIRPGDAIPADVLRFVDRFNDEFVRVGPDAWDAVDTATLGGAYIVKHYAPLLVLEVSA